MLKLNNKFICMIIIYALLFSMLNGAVFAEGESGNSLNLTIDAVTEVNTLISKNNSRKINEISGEDRVKILTQFNVDETTVLYIQNKGYNLKDAINVCRNALDCGLTLSETRSLADIKNGAELIIDLKVLSLFYVSHNIAVADRNAFSRLLLDGYTTNDITDNYVRIENRKRIAQRSAGTGTGEQEPIVVTAQEIREEIEGAESSAGVQSVSMPSSVQNSGMSAMSGSDELLGFTMPYNRYYNNPFGYLINGNELINKSSGSLKISNTDLSIPGRNGLDLNIVTTYDSSKAGLYAPGAEVFYETETYDDWWLYDSIKPDNYDYGTYRLGIGWSFGFSSIEYNEYTRYLHLSDGSAYKIDPQYDDWTQKYYYLNGYPLGECVLEDYTTLDIRLEYNPGIFVGKEGTNVLYAYVLTYKNQKKEYFSGDGKLLFIQDRYNNFIEFYYDLAYFAVGGSQSYFYRIAKIKDTINREVTFQYNNDGVVLIAPDGTSIKYYYTPLQSGYYGDARTLSKKVDALGRETIYEYSDKEATFCFYGRGNYRPSEWTAPYNVIKILTKITYPTGGCAKYGYELAVNNVDSEDGENQYTWMEYYRVESRYDELSAEDAGYYGSSTCNAQHFSYSYNNSSGYPYYRGSDFLPEGYEYTVTMQDSYGKSAVNTFNKDNLLVRREVYAGNIQGPKIEETHHKYDENKLPTEVKTIYIDTANQNYRRTVIESTLYDSYGDILEKHVDGQRLESYTYDPDYHLMDSSAILLDVAAGVRVEQRTEYEVDPDTGNIVSVRQLHFDEGGQDKSIVTDFTYDQYGNVTGKTMRGMSANETFDYNPSAPYYGAYVTERSLTSYDAVGECNGSLHESFEYYPNTGKVKRTTDGNGNFTEYFYDNIGRVTKVSQPPLNPSASGDTLITYYDQYRMVYVRDETGVVNIGQYDSLGRLVEQTEHNEYGDSVISTIFYNENNQVSKVHKPLEHYSEYFYDNKGRLYTAEVNGHSQGAMYYSDVDNITYFVDPSNNLTYKEYDKFGRLGYVGVMEPGQDMETVAYYTYYCTDKVKTAKDGNEQGTFYEYDDLQRLTAVLQISNESATYYTYNDLGLVTEMRLPNMESVFKYHYNDIGQLTGAEDALGQTAYTTYDNAGNVSGYRDRNGTEFSYHYNGRNLPTETYISGDTNPVVWYAYDDAGRVKVAGNENGETRYDYHRNGLLARETKDDGKYIAYEYHDDKNIRKVTDYFGNETTYQYDGRKRLDMVTSSDGTVSYDYYENDMLKSVAYPNGIKAKYDSYDARGRLRSLTHEDTANGAILGKYEYTYDRVNQTSKKVTDAQGVTKEYRYDYDFLNRIKHVIDPDQSVTTYDYDANGNIESVLKTGDAGYTKTCRYDLNNRMQESKLSKNGLDEITQFTYDNNGNMYLSSKSIVQPEAAGGAFASLGIVGEYTDSSLGETAFYTFNELNQLTGYTNLKGIQASYTYDANGLRNSKTVNGTTTDFYTAVGNVLNESVDGIASASNLFAPAYMSRNEGENTSYYLFDGHGDVTQLTNGSGAVTKDYTYDIWGNEDGADDNDTNPFRYCGEYTDLCSGLIYLRGRYYEPEQGRFISEDPIRSGMNWYAYCGNNPVNFIDPSGLTYRPAEDLAAAANCNALMTDDGAYMYNYGNGGFEGSFYEGDGYGSFWQDGVFYIDDEMFFNRFGYSDGDRAIASYALNYQYQYNWTGEHVTSEFKLKTARVAYKLGVNPDDLMSVMAFESWIDPSMVNSIGATGLIQFLPSTAASLGTTTTALKNMSAVDQLYYVYLYLKPYAGRMSTLSDIYMAVLWPAAVGGSENYVLWSQGSTAYRQNNGLDVNGDGRITKAEATQMVINRRNQY